MNGGLEDESILSPVEQQVDMETKQRTLQVKYTRAGGGSDMASIGSDRKSGV